MNKFREIIEYRSQSQREDFLEYLLEKGLNNEERDEFVSIIQSCFPKYNNWTLVLLIDLTNDEEIVSDDLLNLYLQGLSEPKTVYIKLSILDYINKVVGLYRESKASIVFDVLEEFAYNKKNKLILRNQALLIIINRNDAKKNIFLSELVKNIKISKDYRCHIRLYNTLLNNSFFQKIPKNIIIDLIEISKKKMFGRSVSSVIEKLEEELLTSGNI